MGRFIVKQQMNLPAEYIAQQLAVIVDLRVIIFTAY